MAAKFELRSAAGDKFKFVLKAANGEPILTSEIYNSLAAAEKGIAAVKSQAANDNRYVRKNNSAGKPYFVLRAANHEPIGQSESYSSDSARERGIESVKQNAPVALIANLIAAK